ncbi:hypothetical protein KP509_18G073400 [Ceratopteris richardii]|uniref:Uncharacterized protein n=1 Tax=Ceratopteris richardii TaxID=49495 RepID=A0A8T2SSG9_CERRI|nr:hypothetical protein KP509_18G073400 [Ceratopteris richardii]
MNSFTSSAVLLQQICNTMDVFFYHISIVQIRMHLMANAEDAVVAGDRICPSANKLRVDLVIL